MALATCIFFFVMVAAAIIVFGHRTYVKPASAAEEISTAASAAVESAGGASAAEAPFEFTTVLQWVGEKLPQSPADAKITQRLLMAAGFRSDSAPVIYVGLRMVAASGLMALAFLGFQYTSLPYFFRLIGTGVGAFAGFLGSSIVLDSLVKARKQRIKLALPDALDLLVVCVESGIGLDQAIRRVADELRKVHPDLSKELSLVSLEVRAGVDRATALRNLAERTGEAEVRKLTAVLIQTDRFGTSLAESLRTHAEFLRTRRRNEAEERAGKLGVKLTIPIFFLLLPSIGVVAVGPAALKLVKEVLPSLTKGMG